MRFHVLFAVQGGLEGLLAVGTHVGPQVVVDAHVPPQAAARGEGPIADETLEGLEPRVRPAVGFEDSCRDKASPTLRALERLFPRVRPEKERRWDEGARCGHSAGRCDSERTPDKQHRHRSPTSGRSPSRSAQCRPEAAMPAAGRPARPQLLRVLCSLLSLCFSGSSFYFLFIIASTKD